MKLLLFFFTDYFVVFLTVRSYCYYHLLAMSNYRSSNFTAICWATSEVVHHFDNKGSRSRETLNYRIYANTPRTLILEQEIF